MAEPALSEDKLNFLLEKLYRETGWDFRCYRKSSLRRCIARRMSFSRVNYNGYLKLLESNPSEYHNLFNHITIKVSEFFRDPPVFRAIERNILPDIFDHLHRRGQKKLRIWSCGCARGEEAYSVAMLVAKAVFSSITSFRNMARLPPSMIGSLEVKIFATDIDEDALEFARKGIYGVDSLKNVHPFQRNTFFKPLDNGYQVIPFLRSLVTFGIHNIVSDIHLSRMDLVLCRNLLIYFEKHLQEKVFEKFAYSLNKGGYIVLGKSDVLPGSFRDIFCEVDRRGKIYKKIR